ncbi:MAG: N-acetylmuramoyl-L-alanine amidase [Saprospiraceae bacterium]
MTSKFAFGTLAIVAALITLQNFNFLTLDGRRGIPERASWYYVASGGEGKQSRFVANPSAAAAIDPQAAGYRIKTVVLDAGHGGKDPGCLGASSYEKNNTLAIVLRLGAYLEANCPTLKVIYTRDKDEFIELNERAAIANRNKADLFISVHCNSMPSPKGNGTETYVLGVNRAEHNLEVAKRENAVISLEDNYRQNYGGYDPNSPEAHILNSVWQSAYLEQSILFASLVQEQARLQAKREDKGVKQAGFLVIRETAMPAVLIETGYLTNATEETFIASEEGQDKMAYAIFRAFLAYKSQMEGTAVVKAANPAKTTKQPSPKAVPAATQAGPKKPTVIVPAANKTAKGAAPLAAVAKKGYRIQLLSWKTRMDRNSGRLSLLSNVQEEAVNGQYYYFTGTFATQAEAVKMLPEIKNLGFKTAVVVPADGRE